MVIEGHKGYLNGGFFFNLQGTLAETFQQPECFKMLQKNANGLMNINNGKEGQLAM